ncbi:MAG: hypothetical protein JO250_18405 [Armatimonadetes bacterium]|nr:hypothetical protein [Armatimonadota bacterium]
MPTRRTPAPDPKIEVTITWLASHRCRENHVAARGDLTITGADGRPRRWENCRLVFDGFFPIGLALGSYSLFVEGESRGSYRRGTRLIPPRWRRAARWAFYDAALSAEAEMKRKEAEEIAAGTRWAPLPHEALQMRRD